MDETKYLTSVKISLLIKLGVKPRTLATALKVSRPTIYKMRFDRNCPEHDEILDKMLIEHRWFKRPAFVHPPSILVSGRFINPFRYLIHDMKFTPEEVSRETGYSIESVISWSCPSAHVSEFTKEKVSWTFKKFDKIRQAEQPIDRLSQIIEQCGYPNIVKALDEKYSAVYDPLNDPVFAPSGAQK